MLTSPQWVGVVRTTRAALALESGADAPWFAWPQLGDDAFLEAVRRHRLGPVLVPWLEELGASSRVVEELREQHVAVAATCLRQARQLREVVGGLEAAGLRCLVIKGQVLALQTRGDLAARGTGDLDLVVFPDELPAVLAVLADLGLHPLSTVPRPGTAMWGAMVATYYEATLVGDAARTVDLHWRLDPRSDLVPALEAAWARREVLDVAGPVATLSRRDALAHACVHSAKDDWAWLRSLVDVRRLAADPQVRLGRPLSRFERRVVATTAALLGPLPGVGPPHRPTARTAVRAQRADPPSAADVQLPGLGVLLSLRSTMRGTRSPATWARALGMRVLMPVQMGHVTDPRPWVAYPQAVVHRVGGKAVQARAWRPGAPSRSPFATRGLDD